MTRRTLIATLLAAILAPFRRTKAAPVVHPFGCVNARADKRAQVRRFIAARMQQDVSPYPSAIFGLCAKCGGLTCVCD